MPARHVPAPTAAHEAVVLDRPEARNVWRLLPLTQPGLREDHYILPCSRLRQLSDTT